MSTQFLTSGECQLSVLESRSEPMVSPVRPLVRESGPRYIRADQRASFEHTEQLHVSGKSRAETAAVLDALEAIAEPVYLALQHRPLSPDPNDDMVLDVAINGNADAIVTNNTKHFRTAVEHFHLGVLTPAELLSKVRKRR
jgi:nucleotide-binding universal stress UspA family protein